MKWQDTSAWLHDRRDTWIDLFRIYLGIGLFIRGLVFFMGDGQLKLQELAGPDGSAWIFSALMSHYVTLAHLCGGALLAFGLLTRLAALVQLPILIGAVALHAPDGLFSLGQSLEFSAFVLVALSFIILAGPGKLSVDYYTFDRADARDAARVSAFLPRT